MERVKALLKSERFLSILILVLVSAIAYLPFIGRFGYLNDDWYEMYAAQVRGAQVFFPIFSIDRPARAFLMAPLYLLFGQNPLPYNVSAYLFRLAGGLSVLWIFRRLWPELKRVALLASLFFLIYPGFLSQPNAIDFQSHIAGLFFAVFSIALTLQAVLSPRPLTRWLLSAAAIFFGLAYLGQMEYYAGFEVARLVFLYILAGRETTGWRASLKRSVQWWLPFISIPVLFFTWRLFFFSDIRKATDISGQLSSLALTPWHTLAVWGTNLIQSVLDVILLAWGVPLYNFLFGLTPADWVGGLALSLAAVLIVWFLLRPITAASEEPDGRWRQEALWAGLIIVVGGLMTVIVANRSVSFPDYSRYTVISMVGGILILISVLERLQGRAFQTLLIGLLTGMAILTHFANGLYYVRFTDALHTFWWQVSWRVPQMDKGTTLVARYAFGQAGEDYGVWGPANLIYYPQSQDQPVVHPGLYAALIDQDTVINVLLRKAQQYDTRRDIITFRNFRNVLILTQPGPSACVHAIDGNQPELSSLDSQPIMLMAPFSEIFHIQTEAPVQVPPRAVFGSEPERGWCYYYEKASLARQRGDWPTVASLADQAMKLNLAPADPIEWIPFLQAYVYLGNQAELEALAPSVVADPFVAHQACQILSKMDSGSVPRDLISSLYCVQN